MQALKGPLRTAFSLGLQYPPLAEAALAQLERWETSAPDALSVIAPQVRLIASQTCKCWCVHPVATASVQVFTLR